MSDPQYEITKDDINIVLRYLELTRPEQVTPEMATAILERMHIRIHMLEHINPEAIEEVLKELEDS